jgi:hypothetical protein
VAFIFHFFMVYKVFQCAIFKKVFHVSSLYISLFFSQKILAIKIFTSSKKEFKFVFLSSQFSMLHRHQRIVNQRTHPMCSCKSMQRRKPNFRAYGRTKRVSTSFPVFTQVIQWFFKYTNEITCEQSSTSFDLQRKAKAHSQ